MKMRSIFNVIFGLLFPSAMLGSHGGSFAPRGVAAPQAAVQYKPMRQFSRALEMNDIKTAQDLLENAAVNVLDQSSRGFLPIQIADYYGRSTVVDKLKWPTMQAALEQGSDVALWIIKKGLIGANEKIGKAKPRTFAAVAEFNGHKQLADDLRALAASAPAPSPSPSAGLGRGAGGAGRGGAAGVIKFYDRGEDYYAFTNFYDGNPADDPKAAGVKGYDPATGLNLKIDGTSWKTSEHYFQAGKFPNLPQAQEAVRAEPTPRLAFDVARKYDQLKREDWDDAKEDIMWKALYAKFTQHPFLRDELLGTGDARLTEWSPYDDYWGGMLKGSKDRLGQMLMKLRAQLKAEGRGGTPSAAGGGPAERKIKGEKPGGRGAKGAGPAGGAAPKRGTKAPSAVEGKIKGERPKVGGGAGRGVASGKGRGGVAGGGGLSGQMGGLSISSKSADWTDAHQQIADLLMPATFDIGQVTSAAIDLAGSGANLRATVGGKTLRDLAVALDKKSGNSYSTSDPDAWQTLIDLLTAQ